MANYSLKTYFLMLAHYNQWANQQLFSAFETLNEEQLHHDCGAYFGSLMRTANHALVGDILWFERINQLSASNYALDTILCTELAPLQRMRLKQDQHLIRFITKCDELALSKSITYVRHGQKYTEPLAEILAHVFNHQSHHRGQMHSMIYVLMGVSLELDLIYFQREHATVYRGTN